MNKTGIEWCDYTFNPVTGCNHGCPYCYARKIAERFRGSKAWPQGFEPMFHPERLQDLTKIRKSQQSIFVCSMADLFGKWVDQNWIEEVLYAAARTKGQTFIFLTKDPANMVECVDEWRDLRLLTEAKSTLWFGTSITGEGDDHRLEELKQMCTSNLFVSFEPLLGSPGPLDLTGIKQVIIGAQTNPLVLPDPYLVESLVVDATNAGAKVFLKDSLVDTPAWDRSLHQMKTGKALRATAWPLVKA